MKSTVRMENWLQKHRISQFCCSCPVRTGTLVIGILEVLGALSQIIFLFVNVGEALHGQDAAYGSQIASCVLSFIVGLTVLWAVHSRNKDFLLPYLVLRMISWFLINFAIGAFIILTIISQNYLFLLFIAIFIIASALTYYFWRCVISFYFELVEEITSSRQNI